MTALRTPLREIGAYLALAYTFALGIALALPDAGINRMLSVLVPVLTVAVLTFTLTPRGSRRELWRSFGLSRAGFHSWTPALWLPFVLCAAAYGTAVLIGAGQVRDLDITATSATSWLINAAIGFVIGTTFILGEEIGWRGYLLPRMQQLTSRRRAAVATGFAHGLFHLPLILLATTYNTEGARWIAAPAAVAVITAGGVFYAYLWDRSGTVWPVAIAHNMVNTVFEAGSKLVIATSPASLAYVAGETGFATLGIVVAAAIVLLVGAKVWKQTPPSTEGTKRGSTTPPRVVRAR